MVGIEMQDMCARSTGSHRSGGEGPRGEVRLEVPAEGGVTNEGMIVHT